MHHSHLFVLMLLMMACTAEELPQNDSSQDKSLAESHVMNDTDIGDRPETALRSDGQGNLNGGPRSDPSGISTHDSSRTQPGYNLYSSRMATEAVLMDMKGFVIRSWSEKGNDPWLHADLIGNYLYVMGRGNLQKRSWDNESVWKSTDVWGDELNFHHDFEFVDGTLYALTRMVRNLTYQGENLSYLDDMISVIHKDMTIVRNITFRSMIEKEFGDDYIAHMIQFNIRAPRDPDLYDPFHTNSLFVLKKDVPGIADKGDMLVSVHSMNMVIIVDPDEETVLWNWGRGEIEGQHHATIMQNGNMLLFDNGNQRGYSRILEVDPSEKKIVWEYQAPDFYTQVQGGVSELANGNFLVTESGDGHAFEITKDKKIVWEFYNPLLDENNKSQGMYRMKRVYADTIKDLGQEQ